MHNLRYYKGSKGCMWRGTKIMWSNSQVGADTELTMTARCGWINLIMLESNIMIAHLMINLPHIFGGPTSLLFLGWQKMYSVTWMSNHLLGLFLRSMCSPVKTWSLKFSRQNSNNIKEKGINLRNMRGQSKPSLSRSNIKLGPSKNSGSFSHLIMSCFWFIV